MNSLLRTIGSRELRLLLLGAGLVISAVVVSFLLVPTAKTYTSATNEVTVLEEAQANRADLERHLQDRQARIEELKFQLNGATC